MALAQEELKAAKASTTDKLAIKRVGAGRVPGSARAREGSETRKKLLVDYTKGKTIKQLRSEVEKARSSELAKKAILELENSKEKKLEHQIASSHDRRTERRDPRL